MDTDKMRRSFEIFGRSQADKMRGKVEESVMTPFNECNVLKASKHSQGS